MPRSFWPARKPILEAVAAETEVIELLDGLLDQASKNQGGNAAGMMAMMKAMQKGGSQTGKTPGGSNAGGLTQRENVPVGGDPSGNSSEHRKVEKGSGPDLNKVPAEFREALQAYFEKVDNDVRSDNLIGGIPKQQSSRPTIFLSSLLAFCCGGVPLLRAQELFMNHGDPLPPELEGVYLKGLAYLVKTQDKDGGWGDAVYGGGSKQPAVAALSILAMLAHGDDPNSRPYSSAIKRGLEFPAHLNRTAATGYIGTSTHVQPWVLHAGAGRILRGGPG